MPAPPTRPPDRELVWLGPTKRTVLGFPDEVRREVGYALYRAEQGSKHPSAKPLTGEKAFKGASVLEIVEDDEGNTYRAVYTVRFAGAIYILHAFQKKSKKGISTPRKEIETIKLRLIEAARHHEEHFGKRDTA